MSNTHRPYGYGSEHKSLKKGNVKMKVIKIGLVVTATLILFGCISEQERREAQMAQTLVADIRNSIAEKDYEKADRLCSEGKSKCPTVDYDWESVRANARKLKAAEERLAQERKAAEERRKKERAENERNQRIADEANRKLSIDRFWAAVASNAYDCVIKSYDQNRDGKWGKPYKNPFVEFLVKEDAKREAVKKDMEERAKYGYRPVFIRQEKADEDWEAFKKETEKLSVEEKQKRYKEYKAKQEEKKWRDDWLKCWVESRLPLSSNDVQKGTALLDGFASTKMPTAFAKYSECRRVAEEVQKVFNENFPQPWTLRASSNEWAGYCKILNRLALARTEYFRRHDELCHFYSLYRVGALSDSDLTKIDAEPIYERVFSENVESIKLHPAKVNVADEKVLEFAAKCAPETYATYQKLMGKRDVWMKLLETLVEEMRQMDAVRHEIALIACWESINAVSVEINKVVSDWQKLQLDYKIMEKDAATISKWDKERVVSLQNLIDQTQDMIKAYIRTPGVPYGHMVAIPGQKFRIGRTEVTQAQWISVMGYNPSEFKGYSHPVEKVSWLDCQKFIRRVNKASNGTFGLPSRDEWRLACRAGSSNGWGMMANGHQGNLSEMGWAGYYSKKHTMDVALKAPNAFGLYDMHGNVKEWSNDKVLSGQYAGRYYVLGGGWNTIGEACVAENEWEDPSDFRTDEIGFRLVETAQ